MKEQAISKINTIGKIGYVITKIIRILLVIAGVCSLIGAITCLALPKDILSISESTSANVTLNPGAITTVTDENITQIVDSINEDSTGNVTVNGSNAVAHQEGNLVVIEAENYVKNISCRSISFICFCAFVTISLLNAVLYFAGNLCKSFRECETPFSEEVIANIRKLAISMIPWGIFSMIFKGIVDFNFSSGSNFSVALDMDVILTILIIFALSFVFQYGALLQKESDETL